MQLICWGQVVVGVERVLNAPSPQHVGDGRLVFKVGPKSRGCERATWVSSPRTNCSSWAASKIC
jgi:hypothetical protein